MNDLAPEMMSKQYELAKSMLLNAKSGGNLQRAEEIFMALGDYKSSKAFAEKCRMLIECYVGNTITFGCFNGKPIRWRIVDANGKMRMLLSEEILTFKAFNELRVDTNWQSCTLRKWLNREFLNEAFTTTERLSIISTKRTNEPSSVFYTNCGPTTTDKAFVLSHDELDRYLPDQADRKRDRWWWLRTLGCNMLTAESVYEDGTVYPNGINVNHTDVGVRPAIWILLKDH